MAAERAAASDQGQQEVIQRPHRTTSFVPRLGKREQPARAGNLLELICASYSDCLRLANNDQWIDHRAAPLLAVLDNMRSAPDTSDTGVRRPSDEVDEIFLQQVKRNQQALDESRVSVLQDLLNGVGTKRVAFTPRIGRK